ncbi:MAG: hypothetical protein A2V93_12250 [Ignavibacteria bacterium RBG_16_34_14]|nr:MAG: hypothetical protein A2V93_12250 [Ignavibacteria bacterium RBG_16_34_14]
MKFFLLLFSLIAFAFFSGCSGSERFTKKENEIKVISVSNEVRLLIDEAANEIEILIGSRCFLLTEEEKKELINSGQILSFAALNNNLTLKINEKNYEAEYFQLIPFDSTQFLIYNEMKLRGKLKIINNSNSVMMVNSLDLESYLKGVIPKEMPLGKNKENYEALKAFAICARTYSLQQLNSKKYFDLYIDVRDQVYGGVDVEKPISNSAVDETKSLILTYDGRPAKVFYHSTCAGKTEDVKNIFGIDSAYYLSGVEDGNNPYCSISPSFNWEEVYTPEVFIERLKNANLVNDDSDVLEKCFIVSRFESGRVNELRIDLSNSQTGEITSVILQGNNIRSIIRTANNKSILKSIWFDITLDENKNVIITGKGYGHGVGLCQWGAIGQSRAGKNYKEILSHYFPGTKISYLNDKN